MGTKRAFSITQRHFDDVLRIVVRCLLALLVCYASVANAQVILTNPAVSATSGTAGANGTFTVWFSGKAKASASNDTVTQINVFEGGTSISSIDYPPVTDPKTDAIQNIERYIVNQVALAPGQHTLRLVIYTELGGSLDSQSFVITVAPQVELVNDAKILSASVSSSMVTGQQYPASVTVQNTGTTTWQPTGDFPYLLGSQSPQDNLNWGLKRVALAAPVAPGASVTFNFNVTAPGQGQYTFQWQMVREDKGWFGRPTDPITVTVAPPVDSCTSVPASGTYTGAASGGTVWGNNSGGYTTNSNIAMAAVHAGLLRVGVSGRVVVNSLGRVNSFVGSTANGVTSTSLSTPACAMQLSIETPTTPAPTITVQRTPSGPLVVGQVSTQTWSTANAVSVTRTCTASGTGYVGTSSLATSGSRTDTGSAAWVGYPSTCRWTATAADGRTAIFDETMTTSAAPPAPTITVQRTPSGSLVVGQTSTQTWSTTNAISVTRTCTASGTGYAGTSSLATSGSRTDTGNAAWVGYPSTCRWTATAADGRTAIYNETMTTNGDMSQCLAVTPASGSVTGTVSGAVWGNNSGGYTVDSAIGAAAVHAGILQPGVTGNVTVIALGELPNFKGTTSNGLTTSDYPYSFCAMRISAGPAQTTPPKVTWLAPSAATTVIARSGPAMVRVAGTASSTGSSVTEFAVLDNANVIYTSTDPARLDVSLPLVVGNHRLVLRARSSTGTTDSPAITIVVAPGVDGNGAAFFSQNLPTTLRPGQPYNATVAMLNTGTTTWSEQEAYRLGGWNPQDDRTWITTARAYLSAAVAPGQVATFTIPVTAPQKPNSYNMQWRMVRDGKEWFGDASPAPSPLISVVAGTGPTATLTASPTNARVPAGQMLPVTFKASSARSGGVVTKLELLKDSGKGFGSPVATQTGTSADLNWTTTAAVGVGVYRFKVRATDSGGLQTDSAPVVINVPNNDVIGTISGVRTNASGETELYGWACEPGNTAGLGVEVRLDAPTRATGGVLLTSGIANITTEIDSASVESACATPGAGHHFVIGLSRFLSQNAGRSLYVVAKSATSTGSTSLPCPDNSCTMPGTLRVGLTMPTAGAKFVYPAPAFLKLKLTNYSGTFDDVGFMVNDQWIAAQPDGAPGEYSVQKSGLAVSSQPYTVYARVRQRNTTIHSAAAQFYIVSNAAVTVTLSAPAAAKVGTPQALSATVSGSVQSVRFVANGVVVANATNSGTIWTGSWTPSTAGTINLLARAVDGNGTTLAESTPVAVTVTSGAGDELIPVTIMAPHKGNPDAGSLPGTIGVSPDGSASYAMPLAVPPGTAGMQPELSLSYSSNGSNGMLGLGWSLGGLSTIHRCPKTIAQDGIAGRISFDLADRLCLDGQRLLRAAGPNDDAGYWAAGAEYRTELEAFDRIVRLANGGFKVEGKSGRIRYYGADNGSAIAAQGRSDGQKLLWALGRTEDRSGNYMTVDYNVDSTTGEYTPRQIRYGANTVVSQEADLAVRFEYEARPDPQTQYMGGSRNDIRSRLRHIRTYIGTAADGTGGSLVRDHEIAYKISQSSGRSLVDWMQAKGPLSTEVMPRTSFAWGSGGTPMPTQKAEFELNVEANGESTPIKYVTGDFDGTGRSSILIPRQGAMVCTGTGPSCTRRPFIGPIYGRTSDGKPTLYAKLDLSVATEQYSEMITGDMNGDGRDDLVLIDVWNRKWAYCLAVQGSIGSPAFATCQKGGTLPARRPYASDEWDLPALVSLQNDGRAQLLYFDIANQATACGLEATGMVCKGIPTVAPSNVLTTALMPIELSKQGLSDLYMVNNLYDSAAPYQPNVTLCRSGPAGLKCELLESANVGVGPGSGDLNGDGLTDFVYGTGSSEKVCLSTEIGVNCRVAAIRGAETGGTGMVGFGYFFAGISDLRGDGVNRYWGRSTASSPVDSLCRVADAGETCVTVDKSAIPAATVEKINTLETWSRPYYLDNSGVPSSLNCTSIPSYHDGSWYLSCWITSIAGPVAQDRLTTVTDGFGRVDEVDYARGDDTGVYQAVATVSGIQQRPVYDCPKAGQPCLRQQSMSPGVLVKQLRQGTGQGTSIRTNYYYEGAMRDAGGRGSLGFALIRATDTDTGISTERLLSQTFPFVGMERSIRKFSRTCQLETTSNVLQQRAIAMSGGAQNYFRYVSDSTTTKKDADAACSDMGTFVTKSEYTDGWGNLNVQSTTATGDGETFTSKVVTEFMTAGGQVHLAGLPTLVTTTRGNASATVERQVKYEYDQTSGLRTSETVEPLRPEFTVKTIFTRTGNSFGLVSKQTQTWTDPACTSPSWPALCKSDTSRVVASTNYDAKGRFPTDVTDAVGNIETYGYAPGTGVRTSLTQANGVKTIWTLDGFGRVKKEQLIGNGNAIGNETRVSMKKCVGDCPGANVATAQITEYFNGNSQIATPEISYLDSAGRVIRTKRWSFLGAEVVIDQRYDNRGRLFESDQPRLTVDSAGESSAPRLAMRQSWDDLDRIVKTTTLSEGGTEENTITDYQGLSINRTNAKSQLRTERNDVLGRLKQVTDALNGVTKLGYDPFGNLATTVDPNNNITTITYDRLGRKTDLRDPDLGWIHYNVDPLGQVYSQVSPKYRNASDKWAKMTYDLLGRMTGRYESDLQSHWVYDTAPYGKGQLAEAYTGPASAKDYRRVHTYDQFGRPSSTTQLLETGINYLQKFEYDLWGRLVSNIYRRGNSPAKTYKSRYHINGTLARLEREGVVLWSSTYQDAARRNVDLELNGGSLWALNTYNPYSGRITYSDVTDEASIAKTKQDYQYDTLGNVLHRMLWVSGAALSEDFKYDALNRISSSQTLNGPLQSYAYDAAGNIKSKSGQGTYVYPTQGGQSVRPHAVTSVNGSSYAYDDNGNMTSGNGRVICWTTFDMPARIAAGGSGADCTGGSVWSNFRYGPEHQRTIQNRSDGTTIVYGGAQEVELKGSSVTVKTYWPHGVGFEVDQDGVTKQYWVHRDNLGSPVSITGQDNKVVEQLEYDAWGRRRAPDHKSTPNTLDGVFDNKGFTGHEMLDQLDLVHMNGRVYDPIIGRFLSADAVIADPTSGQNFNRYSYVSNNPTNLVDPTGYCEVVTGSLICKTGQALVDAVREVVVYFDGDFSKVSSGKPDVGSRQSSASSRSESAKDNQLSSRVGDEKNTISRTFSDRVETGNAYNGDIVVRQTGTWKEQNSRPYLSPDQWMREWASFNFVEQIAKDGGASERQSKWVGFAAMMVGNPRAAMGNGAEKAVAYSVAFEARIAKQGVGTRPSHFADANKQLQEAMAKDPQFAKMIEDLGIQLPERLGKSPAGWSWHHVPDEPGLLQLVPRGQHGGSFWQSILHPGRLGGFKIWGHEF